MGLSCGAGGRGWGPAAAGAVAGPPPAPGRRGGKVSAVKALLSPGGLLPCAGRSAAAAAGSREAPALWVNLEVNTLIQRAL